MVKVWLLIVMVSNQTTVSVDAAAYKTKALCEAGVEPVTRILSKSFEHVKAGCVEREVLDEASNHR